MGAPGAGKGTQAQRLAARREIPHISSGDIFRSHIERNTALGQKLEHYMNEGLLVPDALACEIVADRLSEADCAEGYILDGFPRSTPQAEELDLLLSERGKAIDLAIDLEVSDDEIVTRLANRRTCPECGRIYNLITQPPKRDGVCDLEPCSGADLIQRDDDKKETIRKRLDVYHEITEPIISFYVAKGVLKPIACSDKSPDAIAEIIEQLVTEICNGQDEVRP